MRAHHLLKEKKKKSRHQLGGFPVVTLMVGHGNPDAGGEVAENNQELMAKRGIQIGSLIDLTKQFPMYQSLIGQVKQITPGNKLKIAVVQSVPVANDTKYPVGTVITMAPNYISKSKVINKPGNQTNENFADRRTASSIAQEIFKNLEDLDHIQRSGSTIAAGNPHNVRSLKQEIIELHQDLSALNFEYAPDQPDLVREKQNNNSVYEEIKLGAPHKKIDRKELQSYLDRIKTGTKTKKDKFSPIVHGSNIKAITKSDNPDDKWNLDDLAQQITSRPRALLGTNAKMEKSKTEGEIIYDLTLPALSGIVVDEGTGDFVEITTCPGAGECQLFCYARKGGYIMFPASSMSAAQALNFLVNDPKGYNDMVNREIAAIKKKTDKAGIQLVVRWHDAGDFFSKEYLDLAFDVARSNPDVQFYAYTKMGDVATANTPNNFIINFSSGSKRREEKKIEIHRSTTKQEVKAGITVPKDMFYDLIDRDGIKLNKDAKGRTQFKSPEALEMFKDRLAAATR
jgi:hypothetical protein